MKSQDNILVVEDDEFLRELIIRTLKKYGYDSNGLSNGKQALEYIFTNPPDILLLDQRLPDMTGQHIIVTLAERGIKLPFIVMTGQGDERLAVEIMKLGAFDYLIKDTEFLDILPITMERLSYSIKRDRELRESEDNLRESKELYQKLLITVPDLIIQTDLNGNITFVNEYTFPIMNYTPRETLFGKNMLSFISEKDLPRAIENTKLMFEHPLGPKEYQLSFEDGEVLEVEVNGDVIYDAENKPTGMVYVIRDITERKRAEQQIQKSELRYSTLINHMSETVTAYEIVRDDNGNPINYRVMDHNKATYMGNPREEVLGKLITDIIGIDIPPNLKELAEAVNTGVPIRHEIFFPIQQRYFDVSMVSWELNRVTAIYTDITERKNAERELILSRNKLKSMLDNLPFLAWLKDAEGRFEAVNEVFALSCGKTIDNIIGKTDYDVWPADYAEKYQADDIEVMKTRTRKDVEEAIPYNKDSVWFETSKTPIFNEQGQVIGTVGISRDITERKKAEESLRQESERFIALAKVSNTGVWEWYQNEMYLWCSPEYFAMLGRNIEDFDLSGKPNLEEVWLNLLHSEDRKIAEKQFMDYHSLGSQGMYENHYRMMHSDGSWVWIWSRGSTLRDITGKLTNKTVGTHINITKQKEVEAELVAQREQLQSIAANLPGVVYQFYALNTGEYGMTYVSGRAQELFELIGDINTFFTEFVENIIPEDREEFMASINKSVVSFSPWFFEGRYLKPSGDTLWFSGSSNPVRLADRIVFNGLLLDITPQKLAEERQAKLTEQLHQSQKMEAVGQLAGGVAHDFNNFLAGIMGFADLLQYTEHLSEVQKKYVSKIITAAENASNLTKKLLAFSRRGTQSNSVVDCLKIIKDTVDILQRTLDKSITIKIHNNAPKTTTMGDESLLQNALMNIGINASHAMPNGGTLIFTLENLTLDKNYCESSPFDIKPGFFLEISVQDTGLGMEPETLSRIFEPFFTTKEQGKGTGLGLPMVYGTIKEHQGAISVYSEVGIGTIFYIYLPLSEELIQGEIGSDSLPIGAGTILIIDDEELIRVSTKGLLESLGYKVLLAENGKEGIEEFTRSQEKINLIILDMIMPIMGGIETFEKLRELDSNLPIIIASGFIKKEDLAKLDKNGVSGFLQKPFRIAELANKVQEALVKG